MDRILASGLLKAKKEVRRGSQRDVAEGEIREIQNIRTRPAIAWREGEGGHVRKA